MTKVQDQRLQRAVSKNGSTIAYERTGEGPAIIIVAAALADRSGTRRLAKVLAPHFTVVNYDRRGRGDSNESGPYAIAREVEDVEALIDEVGGSAVLFGSSSGAVLALDAASQLGPKVTELILFEPPFIVDDTRPPMPGELTGEVRELVAADQRSKVVKTFMAKAMGIPGFAVALMPIFPGWSRMKAAAHTLPYDLTIMQGTQDGQPLPADRWAGSTARTLVLTGGRSEKFFHTGADALVQVLPQAQHTILERQGHGVVLMNPKALLPQITSFLAR